jgi:hypothetical protein
MNVCILAFAALVLHHGLLQRSQAFSPSAPHPQRQHQQHPHPQQRLSRVITRSTSNMNPNLLAFRSQSSLSSWSSSSSSLSSTTTATLEQVQQQLNLDYLPISPFGKNAGPPLAGGSKLILGGKGANLAEMSALGLSVPPGFTITTESCHHYCNSWNQALPKALWDQIVASLTAVENEMNSQFGSPENPLLLSVRSGAAISMPGMMDTVLNLGMNDAVVEGLANKTGNPRFAWDSYR